MVIGTSITSGGTGKNELSAKDTAANACGARGDSAMPIVQSYRRLKCSVLLAAGSLDPMARGEAVRAAAGPSGLRRGGQHGKTSPGEPSVSIRTGQAWQPAASILRETFPDAKHDPRMRLVNQLTSPASS